MVTIYRLNVYKVEQTCLFELSWGQGQRKTAKLPYPSALTVLYQSWQRDYLGYYKSELRSRVGVAGQVISQVNWHSQLGQSEAKLLSEFHRWLRREPLHDIRDQLIQARQTHDSITLFLTCEPIEVARLPWEAWELSAEASGRAPIRIARCPANIRSSTVEPPNRQDKPRVLVIWGDDTNLDMNRDRNTLTEFNALLDITSIGWQPGCDTLTLKQDICKTVANKDGWDMLFFFGHSNEAKVVGGEIAIAPNATLSLQDLTPYLKTAQSKGLQFALFNSCSGIDIADSLIDLGLNQVVIMREPIHNQVAQTFLSHFLHQLAKWCDVHDALLKACQSLKAENHLTYPSAYLIPSLFHHPSAPLFQLEPQGWLTKIQHWLPTRRQAAALGVLALLSVLPPVQQRLLSGRLLAQSIYRQVTLQIPKSSPPVTLIQVDEASIRKSQQLGNPQPINRDYLASLIEQLTEQEVSILGIDYVLDRQQPEDARLASVIQQAVKSGTWLVLSSHWKDNEHILVNPDAQIANPNWSLQGYINAPVRHMVLPGWEDMCYEVCPFTYWLALSHRYRQMLTPGDPKPNLQSQVKFSSTLLNTIEQKQTVHSLQTLSDLKLSSLANQMKTWFGQYWFYPILDFSIPPERVFRRVAAYQLLENTDVLDLDPETIFIIGAGGYEEAGVDGHSDNFTLPVAIAYWRAQDLEANPSNVFPGIEANAYRVHHLLENHLVLTVPDLWIVGLAAFLGKAGERAFRNRKLTRRKSIPVLIITTVAYGLISGQVFITAKILLPLLLPTVAFWFYAFPIVWRRHSYD